MAAYAAVVSLMNTINNIHIHPRFPTSFSNKQIESLCDTAGFLLDFIESYNCSGSSKEVKDLEAEIASAAHAAEDVLESHIVDRILSGDPDGEGASATHVNKALLQKIRKQYMKIFPPRVMRDLQKVTKYMDSIKVYITATFQDQQSTPPPSPAAASSIAGKTSMVGFEEYLIQLMDKLTCRQQSHQQVIPITGMGGIGKTTLARNAFDNLLIKQHFDIRAWATISQNYSTRDILLEIFSSLEDSTYLVDFNEQKVGENLHKCLFNRRYLIILDDMWSIEVWDGIKFFFPDNNNGSRIVVTTRLLEIAFHFNSPYLTVNLLDEDKSWNLFCQETFGKEGCPAELEGVGKKISENCKGLPLSIVVIGGFLRKSSKSREHWEDVARDTYSILNSQGNKHCMKILCLSYNYLPVHLKPCFLYMGNFAEDEEVLVSRLVELWVAEGFLKPNDAQSFEEVAEGYLECLVGRNLIFVNRWGSNGNIKACKIHDLIRELCLGLAEKDDFLYVMKSSRAIKRDCRIIIRERRKAKVFDASRSKQPAHSWICNDERRNGKVFDAFRSQQTARSRICNDERRLDSKLLRVLHADFDVPKRHFLDADLTRVNLRFLYLRCVRYHSQPSLYFPKKISLLWNLQTLRVEGYYGDIVAPSEIWEMVQLRHVQVDNLYVPDPPPNGRGDLVLPNLQTLCSAMNFRLSEEVCKRIPNVKKLNLKYDELPQGCDAGSYFCSQNLGQFHKLESLTLRLRFPNNRPMVLNMTFPSSLKKLTLEGKGLYWEDLEMIGSLPNLEVLKLMYFSMTGSELDPVEGQFRCLKYLQMEFCKTLTKWNADYFHFPVLEKLYLKYLTKLDEIPSGIGEIPTLQIIRLYECSIPCCLSAVKILEEQESFGNDELQVKVVFFRKKTLDIFREMVEQEGGFRSKNLALHTLRSQNTEGTRESWERRPSS